MSALLTVKQVAKMLQLSAKSIYALVSRGDLPAYRIGGAVRVAQADMDAYLATCRSEGPPEPVAGAVRLKYLSL